ncbi:MAG: glycosyltransferase, partial [Candidatus Promineifilaceae bacterium]
MAAGVPVVTTSAVNAGLGAMDNRDLLIADSPSHFAAQVVRLLQDQPMRQNVGQSGREFVRSQFSGNRALERLRAIESMLNG